MQRTIRLLCRLLLVTVLTGPGLAAFAAAAHAPPPPASKATDGKAGEPKAPAQKATPAIGKNEPEIATPGVGGDYLRRVHSRLHGRYTQEFIRTVASTYPASHPLNDLSRQATVTLSIRWDGTIAEGAVKKSSGSPDFDHAALDVARKSAPFPLPPQDVVSDDSYAHVEWTFARDHRACAAGALITRVDDPLDVSLPRLVGGNRVGEAIRRVGDAAKGGDDLALDRFARLYLSRTNPDPVLNVAASVVLAEAGDRAQAARLREALASRATMEMAVRGLHKLGFDICEAVREALQGGPTQARETAIGAVRTAAAIGADTAGCRPPLVAILGDTHAPTALRLLALETFVTLAPASARPVLLTAMLDQDPAVRGAATLASVRKGGGRPEMYRLAPLLHDKAVEVRGAASAGMVRAGGDQALEQLYLLARETDARPGTWVAAELAQLSTPASAEFLGKMAKRNNYQVQVAAVRALAARKDAGARAELEAIMADAQAPSDVKTIASGPQLKPTQPAGQRQQSMVTTAATESVRELLSEHRSRDAATWIVAKFASLEAREAIEVLGIWLLRAPAAAASGAPPPPAAPPETAAPKPAETTTSAFAL
jgi:TonB family protein